MQKRPTSILVFGILHIVFGVLGLCGTVISAAVFAIPNDGADPVITAMHESEPYRLYLIASIPLGVIATAALLAAGIGLLNNKPWSRPLSNFYAWYVIVLTVVSVGVNMVVLVLPAFEALDGPLTPENAGELGGTLGGVCGSFLGLAYPICVLFFLNREVVKNWLSSDRPEYADSFAGPVIEPWDR